MAIVNPLPSGLIIGLTDSGSATDAATINSNFAHGTSGDAMWVKFVAPATQTGTLTVYLYAPTTVGDPTFQLQVLNGDQGVDNERPEASGGAGNLATSPSTLTLSSTDNNTWVAVSATVPMTKNLVYWAIIENTHGTPVSNHTVFQYRPAVDGNSNQALVDSIFQVGITTDGFTSDPLPKSPNLGCAVIKFAAGEIIGNPYTDTATNASDALDRGVQIQFAEDTVVKGLWISQNSSSFGGIEVNLSASPYTTQVAVLKAAQRNQIENQFAVQFEPITLTGGTEYDFVATMTGSTSSGVVYNMGEAEGSLPADVLACRGPSWGYVHDDDGGKTVDASKFMLCGILIDDNPAIAGGGGGGSGVGRGMPRGAV